MYLRRRYVSFGDDASPPTATDLIVGRPLAPQAVQALPAASLDHEGLFATEGSTMPSSGGAAPFDPVAGCIAGGGSPASCASAGPGAIPSLTAIPQAIGALSPSAKLALGIGGALLLYHLFK